MVFRTRIINERELMNLFDDDDYDDNDDDGDDE